MVPDIDIAFVTPYMEKDSHGFIVRKQKTIVGHQSGIAIHLIEISPDSYEPHLQYNEELVTAKVAAKQFVAFN